MKSCFVSGDDVMGDIAVNVGQTEVAAAEAVDEFLVIQAEQVQHGGVQIVEMDFACDGFVTEVIRGAVC